jgi:hypothetical protein
MRHATHAARSTRAMAMAMRRRRTRAEATWSGGAVAWSKDGGTRRPGSLRCVSSRPVVASKVVPVLGSWALSSPRAVRRRANTSPFLWVRAPFVGARVPSRLLFQLHTGLHCYYEPTPPLTSGLE